MLRQCATILLLAGALAGVPSLRAEPTTSLRLLTAENPPLNFSSSSGISGLATEVVRELARRTGTAGGITLVNWPEGYEAVSSQPDVALFSTVLTEERKDLFQWGGHWRCRTPISTPCGDRACVSPTWTRPGRPAGLRR